MVRLGADGMVAIVVAIIAVLAAPVVAPLRAQSVWEEARVFVSVGADRRATVRERYKVPDRVDGQFEFRLLHRQCATPGAVLLNNYATEVQLESNRRGPWTNYVTPGPDRSAYNLDSTGFEVRYDVQLTGGSVDIPVAHITQPISRSNGERAISVTVDLSAVPGARVTFPLFEQHSNNSWRAHFVAIPSFVHVDLPANGTEPSATTGEACREVNVELLDDGGLTWRFWLFVGIMAAWVPIYLTWARRSGEPG